MQLDRSLLTADIVGAQTKPRNTHLNRLQPNYLTFEEQLRLQNQLPQEEIRFGKRQYQNDFHHFCNICTPQGEEYFDRNDKKYYQAPRAKILQFKVLEKQYCHPKLLNTKDIDGAVPGSLQSQAVRNQEIAKKLRLEREIQNKSCNNSQLDELKKNEENYQSHSSRQRSNSFQTGHLNVNIKNQISEQMNSLKLPPIQERISDTIDHVANKLQLRQNRKSFQLDGLDFFKKQVQLKLYA